MQKSWFHHPECTTEQKDALLANYRRRGVEVQASLNPDFFSWTVSARLPESRNPPRVDTRWRNRVWG